ncbi:MAG: hypothetical protein AB1896_04325 [Thermodesulfobacteriota bacterium]
MIAAAQALEMARAYLAAKDRPADDLKVVTDTSDFFRVDYHDVLLLETGAYLILGHEHEGRFGLDDQMKPWVKKAVDLYAGDRKVIKLVFAERFDMKIGPMSYACFRSPKKEARILDLVRGHPNFMQGFSTEDIKGNNVRIIDYVYGPSLHQFISEQDQPHEEYYHWTLPRILDLLLPALDGLAFLHRRLEKHGDVRRDHLICSREGRLVWIDFDFNYRHGEYLAGPDLAGVGNILGFLAGGGDWTLRKIKERRPQILDSLRQEDMNIIFGHRLMNLGKLFPYFSPRLNDILLHFSAGTEVFYGSVDELLSDLKRAREELPA